VIRDDQRAKLLELAARRGEKGFSGLVQEAVDLLLVEEEMRDRRADRVQKVIGALPEEAADRLHAVVRNLRANWR
jgi:hypothetical protein